MRILIVALAAIAALVPGTAEATKKSDPYNPSGSGFVDTKHPKLTKDYYVVHEGKSDKCSIVTGDFGSPPAQAIDSAPYASKDYAKVALKKFPECKGGESDEGEAADDKHRKK